MTESIFSFGLKINKNFAAFVFGKACDGHFVMMPQKRHPLGVLGNLRGFFEERVEDMRIIPLERQEYFSDKRKKIHHVALVAVAEIGFDLRCGTAAQCLGEESH